MSEQELELFGRWLARSLLEVEHGQRSPWAMERFVTPLVLRVLVRTPPRRTTAPVRAGDIGGAAVTAMPAHAFVTVGVAAPGGSWDALLIELRYLAGRWTVVDLGRLRQRCGEQPMGANAMPKARAA